MNEHATVLNELLELATRLERTARAFELAAREQLTRSQGIAARRSRAVRTPSCARFDPEPLVSAMGRKWTQPMAHSSISRMTVSELRMMRGPIRSEG
jgi:hypothetical protein